MNHNPSVINLGDLEVCGADLISLGWDSESEEYEDMITRLNNTFSETCFCLTDNMQQHNVAECWWLFGESLVEK